VIDHDYVGIAHSEIGEHGAGIIRAVVVTKIFRGDADALKRFLQGSYIDMMGSSR